MPALVTCRGRSLEAQWNVGSDDFVLPAFVAIVASMLCSILVVAALVALHVSPKCTEDSTLSPLLKHSFLVLLAIEIATAIIETVIMSVSYRGHIWEIEKRESLPRYIYVRFLILFLEFVVTIICTVATFDSEVHCNSYYVAVALARTASVVIWTKLVVSLVRLFLFLDPCGCLTPGLLQHLSFLDEVDNVGETPTPFQRRYSDSWLTRIFHFQRPSLSHRGTTPTSGPVANRERRTSNIVRFWQRQVSVSQALRGGVTPEEFTHQISHIHRNHVGMRRLERRLRVLFCCLCVGGHRSRGIALEDIARALYTLFDFDDEEAEEGGQESVRLVLSDVIAGFKLVNVYQRRKTERLQEGERLEDKFRMVTFDRMPLNQKPHYRYKPPRPFNNKKVEYHLLVDNMTHYMRHAMAMYGWPLHLFSNMTCGLCQLASKTCCECRCVHPRDPERLHGEGCCMCGLAAMRIQTDVAYEDIYYISMDNAIYKAPFAVTVDKRMKSVVVAVRGTLSIKDALTDMSYSMQYVEIDGVNETYVHKGMYAAADEIRKKLLGRTRQEIRVDAAKQLGQVDETEVEKMMERERRLLQDVFSHHNDYQLIVSGHSLGAGVASVLALLLRKSYPDLHCYAFSPPGCVFSYPLARYSRKFTTSVILGNDVVPRISFRSLLYLKQSVKHLLQNCDKPKCEVLFLPKWCGREHDSSCESNSGPALPEGFEGLIVSGDTTDESLQNAVFPPAHVPLNTASSNTSRQQSMDLLDCPQTFARTIGDFIKNTRGRFMPTFPPGKIFHLKVIKSAKPCFLGCCYPNQLEMEQLRNEDLCMILIDRGVVEDHLPNHVLDSLVRFKQQSLGQHYREEEVERLREVRRRERQEHREARKKTNTAGRWVFPSRSSSSDVLVDHSTRSAYNSATPSTASEATPSTASLATPSSASERVWLRQYSSGSVLPTVFEDQSPVDTKEVHVEIHDDLSPPSDAGMTTATVQSLQQQEASSGAEDVVHKLINYDENKGKTEAHRDSLEPAEMNEISNSTPPSKPRPEFRVELTKRKVTIAEGTPTSIPVQIPFSSPLTDSIDTSAQAKPSLSLPLRQTSTSSETKPNLGRKLLTQLSRGGTTPGDRVLTVQARRGFKLKLIMPSS